MLRRAIEEDWPEPVNLAVELSAEHRAAAVFAPHFYAGFADNALTPVAIPSSADLAVADPLVQLLLSMWPDTSQVEPWGRQLGERAAEQQGPNQRPIKSGYITHAKRAYDRAATWLHSGACTNDRIRAAVEGLAAVRGRLDSVR